MKPKTLVALAFSIIFCLCAIVSEAAVTMSASSTKISRGRPSFVTVTYNISGTTGAQATSASGTFLAGTSVLGTVPSALTVPLAAGSGSFTETIEIPVRVIEGAISQGSTTFLYRRVWNTFGAAGPVIVTAQTAFQVMSDASSDLFIAAITTYFENGRPEVTVEKGFRGLRAFADIRYSGTGLLEGYWEVDGRIISRVFQTLSFGGVVKIQTPDIPDLPTFDPGTHRLKFVVTRPSQPLRVPTLIYYVDLDRFKPNPFVVTALAPGDQTSIDFAPRKFEWQRTGNTALFLVQFGDKLQSKALFSAYTRDTFYTLPESILTQKFERGRQYFWKVIAFDDDNNIVGESRVHAFSFAAGGGR